MTNTFSIDLNTGDSYNVQLQTNEINLLSAAHGSRIEVIISNRLFIHRPEQVF